MELDRYRPGFIIYSDAHTLVTSYGTTTHLIAGNSTQKGYREGVGAEARFGKITGFAQISEKLVVVADSSNCCMRMIDRTTNTTSVFSGQCGSYGYQDGRPGQFSYLWSVMIDKRDKNQLLITDYYNAAVRTVNVMSQVVGTFVKSDSLLYIRGITQEEKSCDLYVTAYNALYRVTYTQRTVSLISGSTGSNPIDSPFNYPNELIFITPETLLVADWDHSKLRLVHVNSDKVTTLNTTNSLSSPGSLLLTNNSLYVGQDKKITQYKCEYNITAIHLKQQNFIQDSVYRIFSI